LHGLIEYNFSLNQNPQTDTSAAFLAGKSKRSEKAILAKLRLYFFLCFSFFFSSFAKTFIFSSPL